MLQATQELIRVHGLEGVTIDEVARRSGVARTTLYRHFGSVDELVLAAVDDMIEPVEAPDTGSFADDLRVIIGAFLTLADDVALRRVFVSMLNRAVADPEFAARYREVKEQRHQPFRAVLQRAIARGEIDPDVDIEHAMQLVQGPFMVKRLVEDDQVTERDLDAFVALACRALAPPV